MSKPPATKGAHYKARPIDEKDEWTDWEVVNDVGVRIAVTNRENGRMIVATLNSHDALLEAAKRIVADYETAPPDEQDARGSEFLDAYEDCKVAIAAAEGEAIS